MPRRYRPVKSNRLFTRTVRYDQINWNDWSDVIRRFEQRLRWWYVRPIQSLRSHRDRGFPTVALSCLLLDALSQYENGLDGSNGQIFKKFVRKWVTGGGLKFPTPIRTWNEKTGKETQAVDLADVLWNGFRCGILHEAHAPLYCAVWGGRKLFEFSPNGGATYADTGKDCPVITLNPRAFADEVCDIVGRFLAQLKNQANAALRAKFRKKFLSSYGIDIGNEP